MLQSGDPAKRDFGKLHELMNMKDREPLSDARKLADLPRLNMLWHLLLTTGLVVVTNTPTAANNNNRETTAQVQSEKAAEFFALSRRNQVRSLVMAGYAGNITNF